MKDTDKTKEQLVKELKALRSRAAQLEKSEAQCKRAEAALKRSSEFLKTVLDSTNDAISVINVQDFKIVGVNRSFLEGLGLKEEEVIGKTCYEVTHHRSDPCTAPDDICPLRDTVTTGGYSVAEHVHYAKDGEKIYVEVSTSPIKDDNGRVIQVVHVSRDITERKQAETALRESERKYRMLVENIPEKIFYKDRNLVYVSCNSGYAQDLKILPEEIAGKTDYEFYPKELAEKYRADDRRVIESGETESIEERYIQDGQERMIQTFKTPARDEEGSVVGVLGIFHDITERKQAEELSRDLFTGSTVGTFILQDRKFQLVNPRFQELTGYTEDELLGADSLDNVFPEDRDVVRENAVKMLKGERYSPYEYRYIKKNGEIMWVMGIVTSIQYQGGRAVLGSFMDITESKQAEVALAAQKELTDRILASTPNTVLVVDGDLQVVLANRAFYGSFRVKRRKVEGRLVGDVLPIEGLAGAIAKTLASRELQLNLEFRYKVDTDEMILDGQIIPMEEEALLILRDVTVERARQEQLYHIDRLAAMGELASGFTHELNNPLTGVLGYSELVLAADIPEEVRKDVEVIHKNAQRAAAIARNVLTFARRQLPEKQSLNIVDLIKRVLETRHYQLEVSNIKVVTEFAEELPGIMADPQQLEQVFLNIIMNAEQAMLEAHGKGRLTVKAEAAKDKVKIVITDDGPGITEENLSRVFNPFFTTREPGKGTGLGLSICHSIVTEHGGRIYAKSKLGEGATFIVELPL